MRLIIKYENNTEQHINKNHYKNIGKNTNINNEINTKN